jgi:hypothetical protein
MKMNDMTWPEPRVVDRQMGSLPMGGAVADAPIHAFAQSPAALCLGPQPGLRTRRSEIELGGLLAFAVEDLITHQEADAIVAASEYFGFREEAPGISTPPGMRMNKAVHWVADEALLGPVMQRLVPLLPPAIDGMVLHGQLSHRLNLYRYDDGDVFNQHVDGDWPGFGLDAERRHMLTWPGLRSALTMIVYLNGPEDGVQGGHTLLRSPRGDWVDVVPRKGSALFFRHGFGPGSVVHVGARVQGAVPKYVARINVMYRLPGA